MYDELHQVRLIEALSLSLNYGRHDSVNPFCIITILHVLSTPSPESDVSHGCANYSYKATGKMSIY